MQQHVDWFGRQILWHTGAAPVVYHHVCLCVLNASRKETIIDMISICSLVKQVELVIVAIPLL